MNENDYFKTSDLCLATYIASCGYVVDSIDRTSATRAEFCFLRDSELDTIVQLFWRKQGQVEPIAFSSIQKELKSRLYNN